MRSMRVGMAAFAMLGLVVASGQDAAPARDAARLEALVLSDSFREADKLAAGILAGPGAGPQTLAVCGLAVLRAGRVGEAAAIFERAVAAGPDCPEAHLGLGRIARIRNDAKAAVEHLERAVPSKAFYGEALRYWWRTAWELGRLADLSEILAHAQERYDREGKPCPSWFTNGYGQIRDLAEKNLFAYDGGPDRLVVPLITPEARPRNKMISLTLNGQRAYPFDIDSASADFLTVSPLLAEELGLKLTGSATSIGVGPAEAQVRFAVLDKVDLGRAAFRNVPVMVSDIRPFAGLRRGILGTAFLKRFNVTIDVEARTMTLCPLDRPDLLDAGIRQASVAADVPLYCFDATTVEASAGGAPAALYILDTAASTNLVDVDFFAEHLKARLDPSRIIPAGIQGAGGAQQVNRIEGLAIALGPLVFEGQVMHEFPMRGLNQIGGRYTAGLIGNPLLWPYRVHMDFRRGRLILEKHRGA